MTTANKLDLTRRGVLVPDGVADGDAINLLQANTAYQGKDATLTALAGVSTSSNKLIYATGSDTFSTTDFGSYGRSLVGVADEAAFKALVNLEIGTDVQAYDAQLADIAGLTPTDNGIVIGNGSNFVVESGSTARTSLGLAIGTDVQAYDAQLADIAGLSTTDGGFIVGDGTNFVLETGNTARTSLGLGTGSSPTFTNLTLSGDLTVNGTTTTVNSTTVEVADSIYHLASGNTSTDSVDIGVYGSYGDGVEKFAGWFRDASDSGKIKFFKGLESEPTTTVNTAGTGYAVATIVANFEGTVDGVNITSLEGRVDTLETFQTTIEGSGGAADVGYDNASSGLTATDVQAAIDEIEDRVDTLESSSGATYKVDKNATSDWGSASGGEYTITIAAGTHGKGTQPDISIYRVSGGNRIPATAEFSTNIAVSNGDITIKVPDSPDGRVALHVQVRG